jgi:hypothetical protein
MKLYEYYLENTDDDNETIDNVKELINTCLTVNNTKKQKNLIKCAERILKNGLEINEDIVNQICFAYFI